MTTKRKFHSVKLSFSIDGSVITRSVSDRLFNNAFIEKSKDPSLSDYESLISVIYTLVRVYAKEAYVQFIECEFVDDMGYKYKIVR